jgi:coenzyme PQQ precursor peptide PqqA
VAALILLSSHAEPPLQRGCSSVFFGFTMVEFVWEDAMAWTTPVLIEVCIGLEINGYLPAEF